MKKEAIMAYTNRMSYVVYYRGNQVLKKLEQLHVDVAYISKKLSYAVLYMDKELEHKVRKALRYTKGFKFFETSKTFDESLNF